MENPMTDFFALLAEVWQALPREVTSMALLAVGVSVFFGIMQMIRA